MSDYRVSYADLSGLQSAIRNLNGDIRGIQNNIHSLDANMQVLRTEVQLKVEAVYKELIELKNLHENEAFIAAARHQLAQKNDEFVNKYGHYKVVRNSARGILQATDIEFIRNNAITVAGEKLFIETPNYWLAPALLALAYWIKNSKETADKAVKEAIVRDNIKTSLFFALVSRRAERLLASKIWLSRYFRSQSPLELSSETIVVIDALTCGVFGVESRQHCMETFLVWKDEIEHDTTLKSKEVSRWRTVLEANRESLSQEQESLYKRLQEYSPNWKEIKSSIEDHYIHQKLYNIFSAIINEEVIFHPGIKEVVDNLLMSLVTDYDAEEIPIRREIRKTSLQVEYGRNWEQYWDAEESVHQTTYQFGELLKNIFMKSVTMNSKEVNVSNSTQKVAIALTKEWIVQAHQEIVSEQLSRVPENVSIKIDGWEGKTKSGDNEEELLKNLIGYLENKEQEEILKNRMSPVVIIIAVASVALPIWIRFDNIKAFLSGNGELQVGLILGGIGLAIAILGFTKFILSKNRQRIENDYEKKRGDYSHIVKATIAEVFNYREEIERHQTVSKKFYEFISQIDVKQYLSTKYDKAREIIMNN